MGMRRFIAGAVCPECRAVDRIVVEQRGDGRERRCVSCGYVDTLAPGGPAVPPTRFSRRTKPDAEASPTAVRIIDPVKRDP